MTRPVLVTGATGKQGGAVVNALLAANTDFHILAVTRDVNSNSAKKLATKSSKITVVQGNLDDTEGIFKSAQNAAGGKPVWGVFSVQTPPMNKAGPAIEEAQGKGLIDSAIKHGVKHFVYSSVDRSGDRSIDNPTDVPHFISKHNIEHHLLAKAQNTDMTWTILRPVAFMENFSVGFFGKDFVTSWRLVVKSRPLQLIAVEDIGVFAAKSFLDPQQFKSRSISLAGDELTFEQMVKVFKSKTGIAPPETWGFVAKTLLSMLKGLGSMYDFLEKEGYGANISELKKVHPGLQDLGAWLEKNYKA